MKLHPTWETKLV